MSCENDYIAGEDVTHMVEGHGMIDLDELERRAQEWLTEWEGARGASRWDAYVIVGNVPALIAELRAAREAQVWPKHEASLALTHNLHKDYYQTVAQSIELGDVDYQRWVSNEQRQKAIAADDCWTLHWYPDTPIGFITLAAADLDVLLAAALAGTGGAR